MNSCGIYEEDSEAHYKIVTEKRGKQQQYRGNPYNAPVDRGKKRMADGKRTSEGGAPTGIVCHKCGRPDHRSNSCTEEVNRCFRCGKTGHEVAECQHKVEICFNYGEEGHISTQC